ncbi:DUF3841 domain-containing protein [Brachybacterium hainanense]|uniref:DUF3841 domain-containing protein n=1 Tax=Brachybacterium hainanense TaxID=1541174 RepID=A0ABV6RC72_9MICO
MILRTPAAASGPRPYDELPRRPWFLAPPRRIATDIGAASLRLHTIQTREAYSTLVRDGRLIGEASRGEPLFQDAYSWMQRQMDDRMIPGHAGGMLWLWASTSHRQLRTCARRTRGDVLLTVTIAPERTLISEFSDWHAVLNQYLHVPVEPGMSDAAWEARWERLGADFEERADEFRSEPLERWPRALRTELESSWEAIFDPSTWQAGRALQATVRELRSADVTRAVRIL